ncbi:MAG: transposase [Bacteroidales bacterium]|nr:transposase [Bacteroidales bacterium]
MFKKSSKDPQIDLFGGVSSLLTGKASKQFNDEQSWHNQFRKEIVSRIDESVFKVLFDETMGAPNSSISVLVGMMILKEAFVWSDSQLFDHCRFDILVRSALGIFNINDEIPVESTYYLLRKHIYEHQQQHHEDLLQKTFDVITREQIKEFNVNGRSIRMDSKLIGSNIAYFSRYEIIHHTLTYFYKTLDESMLHLLSAKDREQLKELSEEEPLKTIYRTTRGEIKSRMQSMGILVYKMVNLFTDQTSEQYMLLKRVFGEQYKVTENQQVELRPKEEIASDSVQSPHDPDSAYRHKGDQQVKGYSVNVTETSSDDSLNLITNVDVRKANVPDTLFVQPAIEATVEVTEQPVEKVFADGAYQSPANDTFCENIDMVFTGIQGFASRYELEETADGLTVTDTLTGECIQATLAKKIKNSKGDKWYIQTGKGRHYFDQKAIRTSKLRREMMNRPIEELQKRNNVEATIFQLSYPLRNSKTKYRGLFKQQLWAVCRCLWINLVRIVKFIEQTCQRTFQNLKNAALSAVYCPVLTIRATPYRRFGLHLSYFVLFVFFINY